MDVKKEKEFYRRCGESVGKGTKSKKKEEPKIPEGELSYLLCEKCGRHTHFHKKCKACGKLIHGEEKCNCSAETKKYLSQTLYWGLTD